jgi:hypothetical protein
MVQVENSQSLENQEQKALTYEQGTIYEAQQNMCYSSRDALGNQTHQNRQHN